MISQDAIVKMAIKLQTSEENIAREYIQHLFLSFLYKHPESQYILFKGGTALRLIYKSPRFSEDVDFTGIILPIKTIEDFILEALRGLENMGISTEISEAKETSGGYLGKFLCHFYVYEIMVKFEVSLRKRAKIAPQITFIENDYIPSYSIYHLPQSELIGEKLRALLERGKARDFFDLYFILRANLLLPQEKKLLKLAKEKTKKISIDFKKELELFLPKSHHPLIKMLKANLLREIERLGV